MRVPSIPANCSFAVASSVADFQAGQALYFHSFRSPRLCGPFVVKAVGRKWVTAQSANNSEIVDRFLPEKMTAACLPTGRGPGRFFLSEHEAHERTRRTDLWRLLQKAVAKPSPPAHLSSEQLNALLGSLRPSQSPDAP